ncbi:MAG TPA: hypothetical protein VIV15_13210, partial [Anaerolineales bacterium]
VALRLPVFVNIFVPLLKAYLSHRWAKLFNDRNVVPFFKYDPLRFTTKEKLKCEIITDNIQAIVQQMGIPARMRQAYFQVLHYGTCLQFPVEAWYTEKQYKNEKEKKIVKQGIRYHFPHPTRTFYDPAFPATSFNTDSGCRYAGNWQIMRWGDIKDHPDYWNLDQVSVGDVDWFSNWGSYFRTVYPCTLKFPEPDANSKTGAGLHDREKVLARYASNDPENSVMLTNYYEKIVPKAIGIGTYDEPVWWRFLVAANRYIIYGEPVLYSPIVYRGYDADENRFRVSSLSLEILPFQDHLGNLLSQYLLSVKQNLDSVTLYDMQQVDPKLIEALKNLGESRYRTRQFVPYDSQESPFAKTDPQKAFMNVAFTPQNTFEILSGVRVLIEVLERSMGFSAQEVGQPATHEQSAREIVTISENTSNRLKFTGTFIDEGDFATQKQHYDAWMAYGDDDVFAQITLSENDKVKKQTLEEMGFKIEDQPSGGETKAGVRGDKSELEVEQFVSARPTGDRINDVALVTAMSQVVQAFISNPLVLQAVGPKQVIDIWNMMARTSGLFPKEFEIHAIEPSEDQNVLMQQAGQAIQQMGQAIIELQKAMQAIPAQIFTTIGEKVVAPIGQKIGQIEQQDKAMAQTIAQQGEVLSKLAAIVSAASQAPPMQPETQQIAIAPNAIPAPATQ